MDIHTGIPYQSVSVWTEDSTAHLADTRHPEAISHPIVWLAHNAKSVCTATPWTLTITIPAHGGLSAQPHPGLLQPPHRHTEVCLHSRALDSHNHHTGTRRSVSCLHSHTLDSYNHHTGTRRHCVTDRAAPASVPTPAEDVTPAVSQRQRPVVSRGATALPRHEMTPRNTR